jgi:hypothetical protein
MTVKMFASFLIYEATRGHLMSHGTLLRDSNRERFSCVCRTQAQRFLNKLGMTNTPWDADQVFWPSRRARWESAVKNIRDAWVGDPVLEGKIWDDVKMRHRKKP